MALALVLAAVAGSASYIYLRDVQSRAYQNAKLTKVYVVSSAIPRGTPEATIVADNLVKQAQIPNQFRPQDAVTDLATIQGDVAVTTLTPGEVIASGLFAAPAAATSATSQSIPPGDVAITVSVGAVQDVAGLVQPGDLVDVLVDVNSNTEKFLFQNATVLAVGTTVAQVASAAPQVASSTPTTTPPPAVSGLITFAVPPLAAARLAFIQSGGGGAGSLFLALVPPDNKPRSVPEVNAGNLIPASLTPG